MSLFLGFENNLIVDNLPLWDKGHAILFSKEQFVDFQRQKSRFYCFLP